MTDKKNTEALDDGDLDAIQGGLWFENWTGVAKTPEVTDRRVNAGGGRDHTRTGKDEGDGFIAFGTETGH